MLQTEISVNNKTSAIRQIIFSINGNLTLSVLNATGLLLGDWKAYTQPGEKRVKKGLLIAAGKKSTGENTQNNILLHRISNRLLLGKLIDIHTGKMHHGRKRLAHSWACSVRDFFFIPPMCKNGAWEFLQGREFSIAISKVYSRLWAWVMQQFWRIPCSFLQRTSFETKQPARNVNSHGEWQQLHPQQLQVTAPKIPAYQLTLPSPPHFFR